jgi:transitional endoplasmic reticulum ATPase
MAEEHDVEALHAQLVRSLHHLPRPAPGAPLGPAAHEFVVWLRGLPADAWRRADEYRHNLEGNPLVRQQLVAACPRLVGLAGRARREAELRAAAEQALTALPVGIHSAWETVTILAAWAAVLRDLLAPDEFAVLSMPFAFLASAETAAPAIAQPSPPRVAPAPPPPVTPRARPPLTFADVGGLEPVKAGLRRALGDVLRHPEPAARLRVRLGGILLHGPPGNGKSFLARATAGEFGLRYLRITGADIGDRRERAEDELRRVFEQARRSAPCLLFLDDLDTLAPAAGEGTDETGRRALCATLVECMTSAVETPGLVVLAATDALEMVDDSLLREGVFDFNVQVPDPDPAARCTILEKQLEGRSRLSKADVDQVVGETQGRSAGYIASLVNRAAQYALHRVSEAEGDVAITREDMWAALRDRLGVVGVRQECRLDWDDLVLSPQTKKRLSVLQRLVEDPGRARALGITRVPRGAVLYGPPRTGKTSIARILASQARCSFFALTGSELKSKWVGDTERRIRRLFREAREARPAIVFIDEIDAIASARGTGDDGGSRAHDSALSQLLAEIDGFQSTEDVLVLGATNRFDLLDPAIVAGGRLSEHIEVPLPDRDDRLRLLHLYTRAMPLVPLVDLRELADATVGMAGGDIESLCSRAAMNALGREATVVGPEDFRTALEDGRLTLN